MVLKWNLKGHSSPPPWSTALSEIYSKTFPHLYFHLFLCSHHEAWFWGVAQNVFLRRKIGEGDQFAEEFTFSLLSIRI